MDIFELMTLKNRASLGDIAYNALNLGCTDNDADATNNTTIIQNAINQGKTIYIPKIIPINDTIAIPNSYHGSVYGKDRNNGGLKMITNGKSIFGFSSDNISFVTIHDVKLFYSTQQTTECYVFYFSLSVASQYGYYHNNFFNIQTSNAYGIVGSDSNAPVWDCNFEHFINYDVYGRALKLAHNSQLGNRFLDFRVQNYTLRNNGYNLGTVACITVNGEFYIEGLSIEDWKGRIFESSFCYGTIKDVHYERGVMSGSNLIFISFFGSLVIENFMMGYLNYTLTSGYATLFRSIGASYLKAINIINKDATKYAGLYAYSSNDASSYADIRRLINMWDLAIGSDGTSDKNKNIILEGKEFNENITYSSVPTSFDILKGEKYYNSSPLPSGYIGWVAIANGYVSNSLSCTATVNYSATVTVSDSTGIAKGDGLFFAADSTMYIVSNVNSTTIITLTEAYAGTLSGATMRKALPSEVLKTFGAINA